MTLGVASWCKDCQNSYSRQRRKLDPKLENLKVRKRKYKARYGITFETYMDMYEKQLGLCSICQRPEESKNVKSLAVDHNHTTGKIRGLLCMRCNTAIGYLRDSLGVVERAMEYLRETN